MSSTAKQTSDDVPFLDACYGKVRYRVVKNRHWNLFSSGRSVKVEFNSVSGSPDDLFFVSSHWKIEVSTGTSKDSLRKAVRNVINKCEYDKITSIIIIMNEGFQFSGSDQIDVIMETALNELAKRNQKEPYYLDDVIVAIEDSTFDLFAELKLVDNQRSKSWRGKSLAWEKFFHRRNKVSTNVVIAGDEREKVLLAKKEIRAIIKPREVRITTAEEVNAVSAQINPGIILYLKSLQNDYYNRWREQVQQMYTIKIDEDAGQNIVTISGAFENILKIEAYLEKDFPSLPNAKHFRKHNKIIEVEERHFEAKENSDQQKKVRKEKEPSVCIDHFEFATHKLKVVIQRSDITRVKTEYIVSEIQANISNHIADQAGKQFKGELKARLDQERGWPVTRCFCTGHGDLKVKQVIHVYCPQNCEEKTTDKLIELSSSMLSCLKMADDLQGESIAIPLLCAETWPFGICINEYFRALIDFNETKALKQALLVDTDAEKVKLAIEGLAKCVENCSDKIIQAASSLSIISSDKCVKLDVASGNLCVSSVDAIVIVEDTSFSHPNETNKQIHDLAGHQYQQKYEECSRQEHKISEVICIEGAAVIGVKGVLIAFPPPWIKQNNLFSTQICKTVDNVFQQIATMKHVRSVSLPCFYSGDETEVKRLCCGLMIKQIVRCLADIPTALKEIHLIFPDPQGVSIMLQEIIKIIQ